MDDGKFESMVVSLLTILEISTKTLKVFLMPTLGHISQGRLVLQSYSLLTHFNLTSNQLSYFISAK